ncbi:MAG: hypothetical protein ACOH1V_13240 [Stenotrophomonas sp.]
MREVVDACNNWFIWDELFKTDQAALDEGLQTIRGEGIEALAGSDDADAH